MRIGHHLTAAEQALLENRVSAHGGYDRAVRGNWLALACGIGNFMLVWWLWGSLRAVPVNHDEAAYLLQAQIFASGRLVAPSPPLPDFFQQWHVLVRPVLAAKYPPGYSLLLVPGVLLGIPGLVPAAMAGASAALLFVMARLVTNLRVALLTVLLSATSPVVLRFSPSYFSEVADSFLWLCAWFALYRHWQTGKRSWLLILALAVGWGGITRPLAMLAFALPAGIAALFTIQRYRSWRDIPAALAIAAAVTALYPCWNARVTGDWRKSAYAQYARQYMPADRIGFGVDPSAPTDSSSAEVLAFDRAVRAGHRGHVVANLPEIAASRAGAILQATWAVGAFAVVLVVPAMLIVPLVVMRLLVATLVVSFAAHLLYAHPSTWTLYYLEFQAPLAFLTACGVYGIAVHASRLVARGERSTPVNAQSIRRIVLVVGTASLAIPAISRIPVYRAQNALQRAYYARFDRALDALPDRRAVVFVRYAGAHDLNLSLVHNVPDVNRAPVWIVHDRGAEDAALLKLAGDRAPYLYHEWRSDGHLYWRIDPFDRRRISGRTTR